MDIQRALVRVVFASNKIPNTLISLPHPDQTNTTKVDTFPPYSFGYLRGHVVLSTLASNTKLAMDIYIYIYIYIRSNNKATAQEAGIEHRNWSL